MFPNIDGEQGLQTVRYGAHLILRAVHSEIIMGGNTAQPHVTGAWMVQCLTGHPYAEFCVVVERLPKYLEETQRHGLFGVRWVGVKVGEVEEMVHISK